MIKEHKLLLKYLLKEWKGQKKILAQEQKLVSKGQVRGTFKKVSNYDFNVSWNQYSASGERNFYFQIYVHVPKPSPFFSVGFFVQQKLQQNLQKLGYDAWVRKSHIDVGQVRNPSKFLNDLKKVIQKTMYMELNGD